MQALPGKDLICSGRLELFELDNPRTFLVGIRVHILLMQDAAFQTSPWTNHLDADGGLLVTQQRDWARHNKAINKQEAGFEERKMLC